MVAAAAIRATMSQHEQIAPFVADHVFPCVGNHEHMYPLVVELRGRGGYGSRHDSYKTGLLAKRFAFSGTSRRQFCEDAVKL
jgi:hypothetical protein